MELTHRQIQELLGAYALDAVDGEERDVVEAHLAGCPRCRSEVAEHREVAALLAHSGTAAPEALWDRIADSLEDEAPPMAPVVVGGERQRRRRPPAGAPLRGGARPRAAALAAAALGLAAAVVIAVLAARVVDQGKELDRLQAAIARGGLYQAALAAEADPTARVVHLRDAAGDDVATVVVLPDGTGYLVRDRLAPLPPHRTYQLWAVTDSAVVSAGVLGPDPGVLAFAAPRNPSALALTAERGGGVVQSAEQPLATGEVPA